MLSYYHPLNTSNRDGSQVAFIDSPSKLTVFLGPQGDFFFLPLNMLDITCEILIFMQIAVYSLWFSLSVTFYLTPNLKYFRGFKLVLKCC